MSSPRRARSTPSGADQLSALPEDVIHHVLSLLPAHEAVRTCVLARRWRHLWTSAPSIRVTGVKGWPDADRFLCFVDRLLTLHRGGSTVLSWEFHLDETDFDPFFNICNVTGKCHTSRLMERILECNVGTLRLCLNNMAPMIGIALLPDLILVSQHLTMLELHGVITNGRVLDFSGCPMLVKMKMESSCIDVKEFSSASLKQLIMVDCQFCKEKRTRFSLPSLVSLELNLYTGRAPLLGSMSSLETATVSLNSQCADSCECEDDYCDGSGCYKDSDNDDKSCVLLKGLSEATHLQLSSHYRAFILRRDEKRCPIFKNLRNLLLSDWCIDADLSALVCFLQHSPVLEKLTLQLSGGFVEPERNHKPFEQLHATHHLNVVIIKCDEVDERVHKILKMLSVNGIPYECIHIQQTNRSSGSGYFSFVCSGFTYS